MSKLKFFPAWFRAAIIILLALGIFFRFVNLDEKIYWSDELATSSRLAGYTLEEYNLERSGKLGRQVVSEIGDRLVTAKDLQNYQFPQLKPGLVESILISAVDEPQLPPLYFTLARLGVQWFGHSATVTRGLASIISLLAFFAVYWLCLELFDSPVTGWIAVSLMSVSPFHLLYAQEARPYSLWTVTILLSSALLLKAVRLKKAWNWGIYAIALAISLYTFLFSVFVAAAHGIYVLTIEKFRLTKTVKLYLLASLVSALAFLPWLFFVVTQARKAAGLTLHVWKPPQVMSPLQLVEAWFLNLSRIFLDLSNLDYGQPTFQHFNFKNLLLYLIILLVCYSLYFLYRNTARPIWLFVFILTGLQGLVFVPFDLIHGGLLSAVPRYLIPCYLGIQLSIAYTLGIQITNINVNVWRQRLWRLVMIALLTGSVVSCVAISQAKVWSNKGYNVQLIGIAQTINRSHHPLVVSDSLYITWLSYLLDDKTRFELVSHTEGNNLCQQGAGRFVENYDVFLFEWSSIFSSNKSLSLACKKDKDYNVELLVNEELDASYQIEASLWKIGKP